MVKDPEELRNIRAAVQLGAGLFDRALEVLRSGVKETDGSGGDGARRAPGRGARDVFCYDHRFGARSALPHGRASDQAIMPGGFVVCDFGVILGGYCSDQTRTVWVGNGSNAAPETRATPTNR